MSTKDKKSKYADHISRLNYGAASNNDFNYEVKLHMEFEETTYIITREAHVPEGKENTNNNFISKLILIKDGETFSDELAQIEINKTIEESISRFFLFDGEMLSEYEELIEGTGGDLSEAIKKSIEDILRITLLKTGRNTLKQLWNSAIQKFNKDDANSEKLKEANILLEEKLKAESDLESEITSLENERSDHVKDSDKIMDEISSKSKQRDLIAENDRLKTENQSLESSIIDYETELQSEFKHAYRQILGLYKKKIITDLKNKEKTINTKLMKFDQANVYEKLLKDAEISAESKLVIQESMPKLDTIEKKQLKDDLYEIETDLKKLESSNIKIDPINELKHLTNSLLDYRAKFALNESKILGNIDALKGENVSQIKELKSEHEKLMKKISNIDVQLNPENANGVVGKLNSIKDDITIMRARMPKEKTKRIQLKSWSYQINIMISLKKA